jgi:polyferredoxin
VPDRLKVRWQKQIDPVPVKYGVLAGFVMTPFLGFSVACPYCNFSLVERTILGAGNLDIGVLSSTNIITLLIWLIILGAFSKGGRGFCSYLCPVGAAQSLMHSIGSKLKFTYKIKLIAERCSLCGVCTTKCPMGALTISNQGLKYQIHNCITCNQCIVACSKAALTYGPILSENVIIERLYRFNEKG